METNMPSIFFSCFSVVRIWAIPALSGVCSYLWSCTSLHVQWWLESVSSPCIWSPSFSGQACCFRAVIIGKHCCSSVSERERERERGTATDLSRMQVWFSVILVDKIRKSENSPRSWLLLFYSFILVMGICLGAPRRHAWIPTLHSSIRLPAYKLCAQPHNAIRHQERKWSRLHCVYRTKCPGTFFFRMPRRRIDICMWPCITHYYLNVQ
jgi:hypothetical protein